ncbi:outer arm dynein light chain 1 [Rozella allomycis CSF55]|uniref:Outer arm dynein light chain 1 n=1 Tax=Rozella allomycis (strain CSF55) TaxID=988480 RepID=A0A075AV06_ROZAC|nr:hypothetical protein O9G_003186 [Rozella allomycis CSF55]RKP17809.1 outer arm dynein light chain 1 [Rozella allomycis CSF55]|eukprot:EPZ34106.1 hypothetical protein O9G_003186 [Rozella allomycis CSF55]
MPPITRELLRKRAEHNDGELSNLEEITLHQYDIEKIELLDVYCRNLKILYLQSNQILKIEGLGKLKRLEYLNLALNNIQVIDGLQGCESLKKLDLTVNFIEALNSIPNLRHNENLKELHLTGNPCTSIENYRHFVIETLSQLTHLDGILIEKSERIKSHQDFRILPDFPKNTNADVKIDEKLLDQALHADMKNDSLPYTPETRLATARETAKLRAEKDKVRQLGSLSELSAVKRKDRILEKNGKILQMNEGKYDFNLIDEDNFLILDLALSKFLDSSLIKVEIQSEFIRVEVKGKMLQLLLPEKVNELEAVAQRSQTTGHLVLKMPKLHQIKNIKSKISKTNAVEKENIVVNIMEKVNVEIPFSSTTDESEVPPLE